jgi:hypothetical protein
MTAGVNVIYGFLSISLGGINAGVYKLPQTQVRFNISATDTLSPQWISYNITGVLKNSGVLSLELNEPCMVYYLITLNGTLAPSLEDMVAQSYLSHASTQS